MKVCVFTAFHGEYGEFAEILRASLERAYPEWAWLKPLDCLDHSSIRRFLFPPAEAMNYDACFIMDADFVMFQSAPTHENWYMNRMRALKTCYFSTHGPWRKPDRFPGGWKGDKERIAGGMVMITPEWMEKTAVERKILGGMLHSGFIGGQYREEDEVILCGLCKKMGLPMPVEKLFPAELRGIHLGDFKPSMRHRWTDTQKMKTRIFRPYVMQYREFMKSIPLVKNGFVRGCLENVESFFKVAGW